MCPLFMRSCALHSGFGCLQGQSGSRGPRVGEEGLAAQVSKDQKVPFHAGH